MSRRESQDIAAQLIVDSSNVEVEPQSLLPNPTNADVFKTLDRKIDYMMGLVLGRRDRMRLAQAVYRAENARPSINQTGGFTRDIPMFCHIELKKEYLSPDPLVQLAVWTTAEFKKRVLEGYDRSMPVACIAIVGHQWNLWIAFDPQPTSPTLSEMVSTAST